jgi:signal peptidase I
MPELPPERFPDSEPSTEGPFAPRPTDQPDPFAQPAPSAWSAPAEATSPLAFSSPTEPEPQHATPDAWALDDPYAWTVAQPGDVTDPALLSTPQPVYGAPYYGGPYGGIATAPPAERRRARGFGRLLREAAETVILAVLIFLFVRAVVQNFQVEGSSMQPTLQTGWYLLVNKAIYFEINLENVHKFVPFVDPGDDPTRYLFRSPQRGDVIVFRDPGIPEGQPERDFIKRIIGEPGDVVEVRDQTVFINGRPLDEPYIFEKPAYTCPPRRVPDGYYFVLGDNRNNSSDSHAWGPVPKENIIGMAWVSYWPFDVFGLIENDSSKLGEGTLQVNKDEVPFLKPPPLGCDA